MYVLSALRIGACPLLNFVKALSNAQSGISLVRTTKLQLVSRGKTEYDLPPMQARVEI
jgi:hypothetical protein